ncbi:MAG: tetratricopeptide repeat protein [Pseudomonadota bacterium]
MTLATPADAQRKTRDQILQDAARAQAAGRPEQAVTLLTSVLSERGLANAKRAIILNDRAIAYARIADYQRAFDDFNASARLFPENAALYNNRAAVLISLELHDEAIKDLDRALVLAPRYSSAMSNRAAARLALGQTTRAWRDFRDAMKGDAKNAVALIARAEMYLDAKRPRSAIRDASAALKIDARSPRAYQVRAEAHLSTGDVQAAIEDYSRAIAFAPKVAQGYFERGLAYIRSANAASAERDFSKALALGDERAVVYRERGHAQILLERFQEAEADLTRSLQIEPRAPEAFAYRALMFKKMGNAEAGLAEIRTAEQFSTSNAVVIWARGEIDEALGKDDRAVEHYRAALALDRGLIAATYGLTRLGIGQSKTEAVLANSHSSGWQVFQDGKGFHARNAAVLGEQRIPLEAVDATTPEIVSWAVREAAGRQIGTLVFAQGLMTGATGEKTSERIPVESAVLIDVAARRVLTEVPARFGEQLTTFDYQSAVVKIAAVDGLTETVSLGRTNRPVAAGTSRRRLSSRRSGSRSRSRARTRSAKRVPAWAPWADSRRTQAQRKRTTRRRYRRRRQPRTLFDLLSGG